MRIFVANKTMNGGVTIDMIVHKGQMFYVDMVEDLPFHNTDLEQVKEFWQELTLYNNYGQIRLVKK